MGGRDAARPARKDACATTRPIGKNVALPKTLGQPRSMVKTKAIIVWAGLCAWFMTGCGDSAKKEPPPAPPATNDAAAASSAGDALKKAAADVTKSAQAEARQQAREATAAAEAAGSQIAASVQSSADPLLKNVGSDLGARVNKLTQSLAGNEPAKQQVTSATKSLLDNKDTQAMSGFGKVTESKLTPEQGVLAKDVYNAAAALVTQRNFSNLEGMNSDVSRLVNSVWKGNYTEAMQPLQKIWTQAKLSDSQKNLLSTTFDRYAPGWRDSAAKVQQGVDALKGLNK